MTERELQRRANRRLAVLRHVEEVSGNVARLVATTASAGSATTAGSAATRPTASTA
jgi:hypothetical protein